MKKWLFTIAALLIALGLIGPKFTGNVFNQQLEQYIDTVNKLGVYEVNIKSREQGWFSTDATIEVGLNMASFDPNAPLPEINIELQADAQHGPILTNEGLSIGLLQWSLGVSDETAASDIVLTGEGPLYRAVGKMNLLGTTRYKDALSAFTYTDAATNMRFSTQGWQGEGYLGAQQTRYAGSMTTLEMAMPGLYELVITDLGVSVQAQGSIYEMILGQLIESTASVGFAQMQVADLLANTQMQMDGFAVNYALEMDDAQGLANFNSQLTLAQLDASDISIRDMVMHSEVNNIEQAFLRAYQDMNKAVAQNPQQANEIMQQVMLDNLLPQLMAEPELNITKFNAQLNNGNIELSSNSKIVGVTSLPDTMESNDFWLEHLQSQTYVDIDDEAAQVIATMVLASQLAQNPDFAQMELSQRTQILQQQSLATLEGLVAQGLLIKTSDGYSMAFVMQDGQASLNDTVIPLAD
jgi:hypothetical protein